MKKILIPLISIATIGVIAPKFVGTKISGDIKSIVSQFNDVPGYEASLVSIEQRWFNSKIVVNVGYDTDYFSKISGHPIAGQSDLFGAISKLSTNVEIDVQHGPLLTQSGLSVGLARWEIEIENAEFREHLDYSKDLSLYTVKGKMGLLGSVSFKDKVAAFTYTDTESNSRWSVEEWNGEGSIGPNGTNYDGLIPSIEGEFSDVKLNMKNLRLDYAMLQSWGELLSNPLYDSHGKFEIDSVELTPTLTNNAFNIEQFIIDFETEKNDDGSLMDMSFTYKLKKLEVADIDVEDFIWTTDIKHIEKSFMEAYQKAAQDLANNEEAIKTLIQDNLLAQLTANPELNISTLSGKINGGDFSGEVFSQLHGIDALPETLEDPSFWLTHATVGAKFNVDKTAAKWMAEQSVMNQLRANPDAAKMSEDELKTIATEQAQLLLDTLTQQGMLTSSDSGYHSVFSLKEGSAILNSNPIPLPL